MVETTDSATDKPADQAPRKVGEMMKAERRLQAIIVRIVGDERQILVQTDENGSISLPHDNFNYRWDREEGRAIRNNSDLLKTIGISSLTSGIHNLAEATTEQRTIYYLAKEPLDVQLDEKKYKWIPLEKGRYLLPKTDSEFLQKISTDWRGDQ